MGCDKDKKQCTMMQCMEWCGHIIVLIHKIHIKIKGHKYMICIYFIMDYYSIRLICEKHLTTTLHQHTRLANLSILDDILK